jgi:hypothetical protein
MHDSMIESTCRGGNRGEGQNRFSAKGAEPGLDGTVSIWNKALSTSFFKLGFFWAAVSGVFSAPKSHR